MGLMNRPTWTAGGAGVFIITTAFGLVPSLENAWVPGILVSAWVGGGGLVLAMMSAGSALHDSTWIAATTEADNEAVGALTYPDVAGELEGAHARLTPGETSFDEENWTWAHNGEIVH